VYRLTEAEEREVERLVRTALERVSNRRGQLSTAQRDAFARAADRQANALAMLKRRCQRDGCGTLFAARCCPRCGWPG
jgi:hypothetical protein